MGATFLSVAPGSEADAISKIELTAKSVILVGERACESAGALSAVAALAHRTGAKIGWVPRRAGEPGAIAAGAIGNLLPGGRPVSDPAARVDVATVWGVDSIPSAVGKNADEIFVAAKTGQLDALVVGGVDPLDSALSAEALSALDQTFVVSFEIRPSAVTARANVVFPVAAVTEKSGSFMNWEGRAREFDTAVEGSLHRSDVRILSMLADAMGKSISLNSVKSASKEFASLSKWDGARATFTPSTSKSLSVGNDEALLTSWRRLLDDGSLQDGEVNLAGTARKSVVVISQKRASALGVVDGDAVKVSNSQGSVTLPVLVENIHDDAVWMPRNSRGSHLLETLGTASGTLVKVGKA
ncbi:unannotated protein [freshwater metagenome]|uniref:Unannotated protein n=1 Tax=freshwater metagenome TaxID=449393 RepID=A0A6J7QVD1_9ZZZZ